MAITTWLLIIFLVLAFLFYGISSLLSSEDESKKSAKRGLTITSIVCFVLAIIIAIIKFMTRSKGTTNATTNGNAAAVAAKANNLEKNILVEKIAELKAKISGQ